MRRENYVTPALDAVELEVESAILAASAEDATIDFGE